MTTNTRRELMTERDKALAAGDIKMFQELTTRLAALPMKGVPPLTAASIKRWNEKGKR